jgi:hypothetical protein
MLLEAARTVEDGGSPKGVNPSYYKVRSLQRVLPVESRWQDAMRGILFDGDEYEPAWLANLTAQGS